jgi:tetratricopeptide (TPR) repeat protein
MLNNAAESFRSLARCPARLLAVLLGLALAFCLAAAPASAAPEPLPSLKTLQSQQAGEMTKPILAAFQNAAGEKPGPDRLLVKAWALRQLGRHEEALTAYEDVLATDPNRLAAHYGKAACLIDLKRTTDSGLAMAEIAKSWPKSLEYLVLKHKNLTKFSTAEKSEWEKQIEEYRPASPAESLFKAEWLFANGRPADALGIYRDLQHDLPDSVVPFLREAEIILAKKDAKDALEAVDRLLARDGGCGAAWRVKGDALAALGKHADALACYNRSEELGVEGVKLYKKRGDLHSTLRSFREALADYTLSLERTPDDYKVLAARFTAYMNLGEQRKAYTDLCRATDLSNDKQPELYYLRGKIAHQLGLRQDAIKSFEKFLQLVSDKNPYRAHAIAALASLSY